MATTIERKFLRFLGTYAKPPMSIMKNETQLNVTIDSKVAKSHKLASKIAGGTIEQMTEAALRFFYGSDAPEIIAMHKRAVKAKVLLEQGQESFFEVARPAYSPLTVTA